MKVRELRPGMVFAPAVPEMTSMIFITQSRHPLWPGLQLVVWRDVETDKVVFDALHTEQVLEGRFHEDDRETQMAWLRRGVLGREAAEDMMAAVRNATRNVAQGMGFSLPRPDRVPESMRGIPGIKHTQFPYKEWENGS
jgi:hypothetical protein